jgi:hypothetical protein
VFLANTEPHERCDPFDWLFGRRAVRAEPFEEPEREPLLDARDAALALPPVGAGDDEPPPRRLRLPWWMNPFARPPDR